MTVSPTARAAARGAPDGASRVSSGLKQHSGGGGGGGGKRSVKPTRIPPNVLGGRCENARWNAAALSLTSSLAASYHLLLFSPALRLLSRAWYVSAQPAHHIFGGARLKR